MFINMNSDFVRILITSFIALIECVMVCDCSNLPNNDSTTQLHNSSTTVLADFIAATEIMPTTATELIDGFTFGMSRKQYQMRYSELEKLECDNVKLEIKGTLYYAQYNQASFYDGKLYELTVLLLHKEPSADDVTKVDFDALAYFFKSIYGTGPSNYMYTEQPVSEFPMHHWRKDNLYFQLSWHPEEEMANIISLKYRNGPICRKAKRLTKEDVKRIGQ